MSFSGEIKKELSEINNLARKEEVKYELLGYLLSDNIVEEKSKIKFSTESEYNINRFGKLLKNINVNDFKIEIQGKVYIITFKKEQIKEIYNLNEEKEELDKALIRGIYMGSGSINNPENKYHLEIKVSKEINRIVKILNKYNISPKTLDNSIYFKDGEQISKFLAFIGAGKSVLKFEEIRVQREMNNKINRLVNCKSANLNKTLNASIEQINAIKKLKEKGTFNKIDESLQELAELRLEYPDISLAELGQMLKSPIGKSGVNYRMKKIIELAK